MNTKKKIHLLIIDAQNDFCDSPPEFRPFNPMKPGERMEPALPVPGADADMTRLGAMIHRLGEKLYDIHATLDSHNPFDIAHGCWWRNEKGDRPGNHTDILLSDVRAGVWRASHPSLQKHSEAYVESLEANGRYKLHIWPEHCLIGQWGHNLHPAVADALNAWARKGMQLVNFVTKGSNALTEHYSAVQAEVPVPNDPATMLNSNLIKTLAEADIILIAGEALSHCVASTVRDIADNFGEENIKKLVLLTDCTSSVGGYEALGEKFIAEMTARGMQTAKSTEFLA